MSAITATLPRWPVPRSIYAILALLAVAALLVPALVVRHGPKVTAIAARVAQPQRVVPKAELPTVEPIAFQALAPTDARAFNASVPFSTAPNPAARPFRIFGSVADQARAVDCLAAAVLYEAGDDASGEKAVAQVVLNRVRHPAFPSTVCGVVFQGSERRTGCQFTFTCDGAIMRAVVPAPWERARTIARNALTGTVDARVGHATHYHTDWVVPYWSSSLDKIVEIHTHLFFRWTGWWGTPGAFSSRYPGVEPAIPQLARLSPAHLGAAGAAGLVTAALDPALLGTATVPVDGTAQDTNTFLVTLDGKLTPDAFPTLATKACGDRPYCKFMAWSSKAATPAALPVTPVQQRAMTFSYLRDRAFNFEKALWNCGEHKRLDPRECMKAQMSITMAAPAPPPAVFASELKSGPAVKPNAGAEMPAPLGGVRRKGEITPLTVTTLPVRTTLPAPAATPAAKAP